MGAASYINISEQHDKIAIIASGMSLADVDLTTLSKTGYVICINDSWRKYPDPDVVVTIDTVKLDERFSDCPHKVIVGVPDGFGTRRVQGTDCQWPRSPLFYMHRKMELGLAHDPSVLNCGESSGFAAINLAYHMRPKHLFLFGLDLYSMELHCHPHTDPRIRPQAVWDRLPSNYATTIAPLAALGVKVYNGSLNSLVPGFERMLPEKCIDLWNQIGV